VPARTDILYREVVADLSPGWKGPALPLTAANDGETPPFPMNTTLGSRVTDLLPLPAPLLLYRVLVDGTLDAGNVLRIAKSPTVPGTLDIAF
jgi:hypothetical protein